MNAWSFSAALINNESLSYNEINIFSSAYFSFEKGDLFVGMAMAGGKSRNE